MPRLTSHRAKKLLREQALRDRDKEFKLRPEKPRIGSSGGLHSLAKRYLKRVASGGRKRRPYSYKSPSGNQRCAVRFRYSTSRRAGLWKAHGKYIERETASGKRRGEAGFDARDKNIGGIPEKLDGWQQTDEKLWKMILSPEFGADIDLRKLTRKVLAQMEKDLGTKLEWMAVIHLNTDHPHVHVVLRGVRDNGQPLELPGEYVKRGVRAIAEAEITRELGPRKKRQVVLDQGWRMTQTGRQR